MVKTLLLTQRQLDEIINGTPYLDTTGNGMPSNIHSNEVSVEAGGVEEPHTPYDKAPTTDDITKMMGPPTNHWPGPGFGGKGSRSSGLPIAAGLGESYTKKEFEKMMLQELNDQLNGITMTATIPNQADPTNPTVISGKEGKLAKDKSEALARGDKQTAFAIDKALSAQRNRIKSGKEVRTQMGMTNQYQKAGGTKNNGGTAHTAKNNDNMVQVFEPNNL